MTSSYCVTSLQHTRLKVHRLSLWQDQQSGGGRWYITSSARRVQASRIQRRPKSWSIWRIASISSMAKMHYHCFIWCTSLYVNDDKEMSINSAYDQQHWRNFLSNWSVNRPIDVSVKHLNIWTFEKRNTFLCEAWSQIDRSHLGFLGLSGQPACWPAVCECIN